MRIKWGVLVVAISCAATALAMAIPGQDDSSSGVVGAVERGHSQVGQQGADWGEQAQSEKQFDLSEIKRAAPDSIHASGLFQSKSWYTPLPSSQAGRSPTKSATGLPATPIPLLPPNAPQLPFTFIGRMIDGSVITLFLTSNHQLYSAKLSDILDGTYRVDRIAEKSAVLTYLPLNIQQELVFNSTAIGISALNVSTPETAMHLSMPNPQQIKYPQ